MTTSRDIQAKINQNAAQQQDLLSSDTPNKAAALATLREEQDKLIRLRDALALEERGQGPRERVGVAANLSEAQRWAAVLKRAQETS
jgi:hypothetical protein